MAAVGRSSSARYTNPSQTSPRSPPRWPDPTTTPPAPPRQPPPPTPTTPHRPPTLADHIRAKIMGADSGAAAPLSNEPDRLETFLLDPDADDHARTLLADRLQAILSKSDKARSSAMADEPDLESATDNQLF